MSAESSPKRAVARATIGLLLGLVLVFSLPTASAHAGDGWWGALDEGEAVSLLDIMRSPSEFRGRTLTFFCVFHRKENYFDPMRTPFTPKRYDNFSAWPDGSPVWDEQAYVADMPFLYIPRSHEQRDDLMRLEPFTRIEITGRIRDLLRGRPTIEVFSFRRTGHRLGRKVVDAVMRANNQARIATEIGYQMAARNLKSALQPDLPPLYDMQIRKLLGQCLRKMGHESEAFAYERGETFGGANLAKADPTARAPSGLDRHGRPIAQPAAGGDLRPGAPVLAGDSSTGLGDPDGGTGEYPGAFQDTPPAEPARPSTARARRPVSSAPRAPIARGDDLPGAPAAPIARDEDLPGSPGQAPPPPPVWNKGRVRQPAIPSPDQPGGLPPPSRAQGAARQPGSGDLPGSPSYPPVRTPKPGATSPARPQGQPAAAGTRTSPPSVRRGPVSGIPPKRTPRLSGVR